MKYYLVTMQTRYKPSGEDMVETLPCQGDPAEFFLELCTHSNREGSKYEIPLLLNSLEVSLDQFNAFCDIY